MKTKWSRVIAGLLCAGMLTVSFPAAAAENAAEATSDTEKVLTTIDEIEKIGEQADSNITEDEIISIAFKIGDSTLKINGQDVTVRAPYEKEGTTLVPVRVITEAFGAKVDWSEADEKVTLTYEDVVIEIWIGSTKAKVNGMEQGLLLAPELAEDTTMVPLRFITENFGADVSYNDVTESVTVEKKISGGSAISDYSNILHSSDKEYFGDSYYGWSMKNSKEYNIVSRSFPGDLTIISNDDGTAGIIIMIQYAGSKTESELFSSLKEDLNKKTVAVQKTEKGEDGLNYFYCEAKSTENSLVVKAAYKDDMLYRAVAIVDSDADASVKNETLEVLKTFKANTGSFSDVADLSEVKDGFREYKNNEYNFSMNLPAYMIDLGNSNKLNEFRFIGKEHNTDNQLAVYVGVQSKDNAKLSEWVNESYKKDVEEFNPSCVEISEVQDLELGGISAKGYTLSIDYSDIQECTQVFLFELGEYVYRSTFSYSPELEADIETIKQSMTFAPIDKSKVGSLMIVSNEDNTTEHSVSKISFSAPSGYKESLRSENMLMLYNSNNRYELYVMPEQKTASLPEYRINNMSKYFETKFTKIADVKPYGLVSLGGRAGYLKAIEIEDNEGEKYILEMSVFPMSSYDLEIIRMIPTILYGESAMNELKTIAASLSIAE